MLMMHCCQGLCISLPRSHRFLMCLHTAIWGPSCLVDKSVTGPKSSH